MPVPNMRVWISVVAELFAVAAAACGGNGNHAAAGTAIDAAPAPDTPAPDGVMPDAAPPPCSYTERADASNDPTADPATDPRPEPTLITVGARPQTLCGTIDRGHFNADTRTVDADAYRVTAEAPADLLVRFSGVPEAGVMVEFSVFVFTTDDNPTLLYGGSNNPIIRDHGAFLLSLPAGTYDVVVAARGPADLETAFDYKVQIAPDGPARCAAITAPANYTESADGTGADPDGGNHGNDVIAVDFDLDPAFQLTASTADAAEPTGITIDTVAAIRIAGSIADVDADDDYLDRDTYLIRTGPATGELTLRLGWASPRADLNYLVFPADPTGEVGEVGDSLRFDGTEEYNVVAVKPSSAYWIWVGGHDGSVDLPATYDLSICGAPVLR
jgi:hypothetical protein